jgi:hypothetical protein
MTTKVSDIGPSSRSSKPADTAGWTYQHVEDRVVEATEILRRIAERGLDGALPLWLTTTVRTDSMSPLAPHTPTPTALSRMHEVLSWLSWLEPDVARLTWARAQGVSWKSVAYRFGLSVRTAQRQRRYALGVILWRLHDRPIPRTWSRQFLLARVAALSRGN